MHFVEGEVIIAIVFLSGADEVCCHTNWVVTPRKPGEPTPGFFLWIDAVSRRTWAPGRQREGRSDTPACPAHIVYQIRALMDENIDTLFSL